MGVGWPASQTPPGIDSPVAAIYTSGRRAFAARTASLDSRVYPSGFSALPGSQTIGRSRQSTTATGAGDATGLCAGEVRRWSRGHSSSNATASNVQQPPERGTLRDFSRAKSATGPEDIAPPTRCRHLTKRRAESCKQSINSDLLRVSTRARPGGQAGSYSAC
ncbi:hypothetical protein Bbelb_250770 [Branchiostoma belcheri]|nr:hypothetical protein Bbelb_250770 [Branchiostoma belcheri]